MIRVIRTDHKAHFPCKDNFPGGEVNVSINTSLLSEFVTVDAIIKTSDDIMQLLMTVDALRRCNKVKFIDLYMPYVPYARQDRVCNEGEALSIKVLCDLINNMKFRTVTIIDPHSDVTPALLDNCLVIKQGHRIPRPLLKLVTAGKLTLVAPDLGATKKVESLCADLGVSTYIQGFKHRDLATGKLSGFGYSGDVKGKHLLIVDDICDGGGTFAGLGGVLKAAGCYEITLYVSHGIFSRGTKIDNIDEVLFPIDLRRD